MTVRPVPAYWLNPCAEETGMRLDFVHATADGSLQLLGRRAVRIRTASLTLLGSHGERQREDTSLDR